MRKIAFLLFSSCVVLPIKTTSTATDLLMIASTGYCAIKAAQMCVQAWQHPKLEQRILRAIAPLAISSFTLGVCYNVWREKNELEWLGHGVMVALPLALYGLGSTKFYQPERKAIT